MEPQASMPHSQGLYNNPILSRINQFLVLTSISVYLIVSSINAYAFLKVSFL